MKKAVLISVLLEAFILSSCQQNEEFEKEIVSYYQKRYKMIGQERYSKNDELRSDLFFSKNFLYAKNYLFEPKNEKSKKYEPFSRICIYYYNNKPSPIKVVNSIDSLNNWTIEEGFYGPFGKEYNLFFSSGNIVVHLERSCNVSQDYWENMKNEVFAIARQSFKKIGGIVDKQCE